MKTALDRPLEHPRACLRRLARGAEGVSAGDVLEDDPAAALREALAEQLKRVLDALDVVVGRDGQVLRRQGLRGDDEQRLDRARELLDRARCVIRRSGRSTNCLLPRR